MRTKSFAAVLLVSALSIAGGARAGQGLCAADETAFLTCTVSTGKTLSLCGASTSSPNGAYLQYRYGTPGAVEVRFPESQRESLSQFRWRTDFHADVEASWLIFHLSGEKYSVYAMHDAVAPDGGAGHRYGVIVTDPKGAEAIIPCTADITSKLDELPSGLPPAGDDE